MNKENLKREYEYWKKVIENSEEKIQIEKDEFKHKLFAEGFVAAINKTEIFND